MSRPIRLKPVILPPSKRREALCPTHLAALRVVGELDQRHRLAAEVLAGVVRAHAELVLRQDQVEVVHPPVLFERVAGGQDRLRVGKEIIAGDIGGVDHVGGVLDDLAVALLRGLKRGLGRLAGGHVREREDGAVDLAKRDDRRRGVGDRDRRVIAPAEAVLVDPGHAAGGERLEHRAVRHALVRDRAASLVQQVVQVAVEQFLGRPTEGAFRGRVGEGDAAGAVDGAEAAGEVIGDREGEVELAADTLARLFRLGIGAATRDRRCGVLDQRLGEGQVGAGEEAGAAVADDQHADRVVIGAQRHAEQRAQPHPVEEGRLLRQDRAAVLDDGAAARTPELSERAGTVDRHRRSLPACDLVAGADFAAERSAAEVAVAVQQVDAGDVGVEGACGLVADRAQRRFLVERTAGGEGGGVEGGQLARPAGVIVAQAAGRDGEADLIGDTARQAELAGVEAALTTRAEQQQPDAALAVAEGKDEQPLQGNGVEQAARERLRGDRPPARR
jgi:hypothetical protein